MEIKDDENQDKFFSQRKLSQRKFFNSSQKQESTLEQSNSSQKQAIENYNECTRIYQQRVKPHIESSTMLRQLQGNNQSSATFLPTINQESNNKIYIIRKAKLIQEQLLKNENSYSQLLRVPIIMNSHKSLTASGQFSKVEQSPKVCKPKTLNQGYIQDYLQNFSCEITQLPHLIQQQKIKVRPFLEGHLMKESHRTKMIDWMIQVFRVLNKSTDKTFFIAVQILDNYFYAKSQVGQHIKKSELHLIGLTCCYIASKIEDEIQVSMQEMLSQAAHGKFSQSEIIAKELEILRILEFKLIQRTLIDNIFEKFELLQSKITTNPIPISELNSIRNLITFFARILLHDYTLSTLPEEIQIYLVLTQALEYKLVTLQKENYLQQQRINNGYWLTQQEQVASNSRLFMIQNVNSLLIAFENQNQKTVCEGLQKNKDVYLVTLKCLIKRFQLNQSGYNNLMKSYPEYAIQSEDEFPHDFMTRRLVEKKYSSSTASSKNSISDD